MFQSHGGFSSLAQDAKELQYKLQRFFAQKGPPPLEAPMGAHGPIRAFGPSALGAWHENESVSVEIVPTQKRCELNSVWKCEAGINFGINKE